MVFGLLGVPQIFVSGLAGAVNAGSAGYFGALPGGRALVKWAGLSNAGVVAAGMWFGQDDPYLQSATAAIACASMAGVMGLHVVRTAGSAGAHQLLHAKIASATCGVLAVDQTVCTVMRREKRW